MGPGTWVWNGSEQRWQPASAWPELRWDLPAAPPVLPPPPPEPVFIDAEFPLRAAAFVLDTLIIGALFSVVTIPWADHFREVQESMLAAVEAARRTVDPKPLDPSLVLKFYTLFLGTFLPVRMAYFVGFHGALGATPGKLIFGLRVICTDGTALSFPRAIVRHIAEVFSLAAFGVGYLVAAFHPERRALHDLIANTRVVRRTPGMAPVPDKA